MSFVLKLSWSHDKTLKEATVLNMARRALEQATTKLAEEERLRYGLRTRVLKTCLLIILWNEDIMNPRRGSLPKGRLKWLTHSDTYYEPRGHSIGRILVSEVLFPFYLLDNLEDYKEAMRHIVLGEFSITIKVILTHVLRMCSLPRCERAENTTSNYQSE